MTLPNVPAYARPDALDPGRYVWTEHPTRPRGCRAGRYVVSRAHEEASASAAQTAPDLSPGLAHNQAHYINQRPPWTPHPVVVATEHCPGPGRTRHYRSSMPHLSGGRGCPSALGGSPSVGSSSFEEGAGPRALRGGVGLPARPPTRHASACHASPASFDRMFCASQPPIMRDAGSAAGFRRWGPCVRTCCG